MQASSLFASFGVLLHSSSLVSATDISRSEPEPAACSVFHQTVPYHCRSMADSFADVGAVMKTSVSDATVLEEAFSALAVLQNTYFEPVNGTWPTSIDWTGAVVETILSGTLNSMTKSLDTAVQGHDWIQKETLISSVFAHITHSFFGQNAVGILDEAYDDVLWVVLGWLEAIKFARLHSALHHPDKEEECLRVPVDLDAALGTVSWHGSRWLCTFAQRARAFWDFATHGWDTKLCHGGMIWNPRLTPYKNAITNELWIAASISMYEHFPGDKFNEIWVATQGFSNDTAVYLSAAVVGYKWLKNVNMTNSQGLFVDGFHVDRSKPGNVECDQRDEMVYTYNQGVILTGQRGLFAATGSPSYLEEGHKLIQNVINATGWDIRKNKPIDDIRDPNHGHLPPWRGIGRYGILEEQCDAAGTCSQDGQTFKGIFFHHFTAFCAPVNRSEISAVSVLDETEFSKVTASHERTCRAYTGWVKHNVDAALQTRDAAGRFGMWWGGGIFRQVNASVQTDGVSHAAPNTTDYRNQGTPLDSTWSLNATWKPGTRSPVPQCQGSLLRLDPLIRIDDSPPTIVRLLLSKRAGDANDRGRGRTVETQAGGLALLRAYWELSHE